MRRIKGAIGAVLLLSSSLINAISPSDIPEDTPLSILIDSAKASLAQGNSHDALAYYDAAITRDPTNYLAIFQRGATYLLLGRDGFAGDDFDTVLSIKPDFESALLQRARLKARNAEWEAAKDDYRRAGRKDEPEFQELLEAQNAVKAAEVADATGDWEGCVTHAGTAIMVASKVLALRQLRAHCRFERGEMQEGISDLQHVLQLSSGSIDPYLRISATLFYSLGDTEKGLTQIKKCLHSDPDSKPCSKLYRQERADNKQYERLMQYQEKRQFSNAVKILVGNEEDPGLIQDVKEAVNGYKGDGTVPQKAPDDFYAKLVELACELYGEMNSKKRAEPYCEEILNMNPNSLHGLLYKAQKQLDSDEFEPAIQTLNQAKEHHPSAGQIQSLLQRAHMLLKRSKTKDYYKVLDVSRDADERTIKKAYRTLTKKFHPDKAIAQGLSKEESEKKMAAINEAYEVLSDPEKKAMFDRGEDPNSHERQGAPFQGSPFGGGQQFFFQSGGGGRQQFQFNFPGGGFPGGFPFGQ